MTFGQGVYFGNKNTFAVRYARGYTDKDNGHFYAYCHLVLGGQIIGDKDELFFKKSWHYSLERIKERIRNNFSDISNNEFINRSDREIFELVWKANQLEEEYKPEYAYLPVLSNEVWSNCGLSIGETTDAYLMVMVGSGNDVKFTWEGWRAPCPEERTGKLFTVSIGQGFCSYYTGEMPG